MRRGGVVSCHLIRAVHLHSHFAFALSSCFALRFVDLVSLVYVFPVCFLFPLPGTELFPRTLLIFLLGINPLVRLDNHLTMPRMTRNSQESLPSPPTSSAAPSVVTSGAAAVVSSATCSAPVDSPSAEFVASLVQAMRAPIESMVSSALSSAGIALPTVTSATSSASQLAASSPHSSLSLQANSLGQRGSALPWTHNTGNVTHPLSQPPSLPQAASLTSVAQGRSDLFNVPPFVATLTNPSFGPPVSVNNPVGISTPINSNYTTNPASLPYWNSGQSPSVPANVPLLQQPFVIGPGYSPVPYKVVSQIACGKYINLEDLLPENITGQDPEPRLVFEGRLVFTPTPRKPKRQITDIVTWLEAFTIFSFILCTYFPNRWVDLTKYKLLILRTYRQFSGSAWLNYDKEFRQQAAAERLSDWASMNVQLYNFHTAGAQVRPRIPAANSSSTEHEATGNQGSKVVCLSWNAGRCVAPSSHCRFSHVCSSCHGDHRVSACTHTSGQPPSGGQEHNKRRKYN